MIGPCIHPMEPIGFLSFLKVRVLSVDKPFACNPFLSLFLGIEHFFRKLCVPQDIVYPLTVNKIHFPYAVRRLWRGWFWRYIIKE